MAKSAGKKGIWTLLRKLKYISGIGLTSLALFYAGSKSNSIVARIEDSLFYVNVPIAKNSFPDPAGLEIIVEINEDGAKEPYLAHVSSGKRVSIGYDMLPKEPLVLAQALERRLLGENGRQRIEPDARTEYKEALASLAIAAREATKSYDASTRIIRGEKR